MGHKKSPTRLSAERQDKMPSYLFHCFDAEGKLLDTIDKYRFQDNQQASEFANALLRYNAAVDGRKIVSIHIFRLCETVIKED
jgi:hypothetical protein